MPIKSILILLWLMLPTMALSSPTDDLFTAAILGKIERVKFLLNEGIEVDGKTANGRTALMAASFNGNIRVVKLLLAYGADVNLADRQGHTALMDAVVFGNEALVKLLITVGANIEVVDLQKSSALDKAEKIQSPNIVKILKSATKSVKGNNKAEAKPKPTGNDDNKTDKAPTPQS